MLLCMWEENKKDTEFQVWSLECQVGDRLHHQRALQYHNSSQRVTKHLEAPKMFDKRALGGNRRGIKRIQETKEAFFSVVLPLMEPEGWMNCLNTFFQSAETCADKYSNHSSFTLARLSKRATFLCTHVNAVSGNMEIYCLYSDVSWGKLLLNKV